MATYDNLPVYKEGYDLLLALFTYVKDCSRDYKYTLGESIKNETVAMITEIYRANSVEDKREHLRRAREHVETIRLFLRILKDLKQISVAKFAKLNLHLESVSKQLAAWHRSCR